MVDWKTYRIIRLERKTSCSSSSKFVNLYLDGDVEYDRNDRTSEISFNNHHPCDSLQTEDYVEIDLDYTRTRSFNEVLGNNNAIRKLSSSSSTNIITTRGSSSDIVISPSAVNYMKSPEAMEMAHRMSRMVDETGKNWEYKIEAENKDGKKISHSLICRKD